MLNRQNAITQTLHGLSHANNNAGQSLMKSITQQESKNNQHIMSHEKAS